MEEFNIGNLEPSTTSLILNRDELEALLIAIKDSSDKAASVISIANDPVEYNRAISGLIETGNLGQEKAEEYFEDCIELAESLLETYGPIVNQIREVLPEVVDEDKLRNPHFIIKP